MAITFCRFPLAPLYGQELPIDRHRLRPRERGNLKGRHKDVFVRLKQDWETWSATAQRRCGQAACLANAVNPSARSLTR